jgi:hypothetical protein
VENVLADALGAGAGTALLAAAAVGLMLSPGLLLRSATPPAVLLAFAGVWVGALAASLAGSYPTPVVGFGGSAILGYLLSIGTAGNRLLRPGKAAASDPAAADPQAGSETMKFALNAMDAGADKPPGFHASTFRRR